ncbi:MAG TPA: DeoR/GlpR family DNA-binding transcription regulator [Mycobacteriales bacterium]|jgi:DeoR family fructose operon transcriptional repressor|nr:DeoR/GlpR family DNA-binding transcription regulator [Mycobacteriales bacterium]
MYAAERQQQILQQARAHGRVEVTALAADLDVTPETIRRDLSVLVRHGTLRRAHGGAIPVERLVTFEPEITARSAIMAEAKQRIARAALVEIPQQGTIFIEAGSTPGALADLLPANRSLTVVTTGLSIALGLATKPKITVLIVGGRVRGRTLAAVDDWALRDLAELHVDVSFLGTNGFSVSGGLTTPDVAEAAVKRAALSIGRRTVLLADHSKLGVLTLCGYGAISAIDLVVTDQLTHQDVTELTTAGVEVRQA